MVVVFDIPRSLPFPRLNAEPVLWREWLVGRVHHLGVGVCFDRGMSKRVRRLNDAEGRQLQQDEDANYTTPSSRLSHCGQDRGLLCPHGRRRDVRPVRVRPADPLLLRHCQPRRRAALHGRLRYAATRRPGRRRILLGAPFLSAQFEIGDARTLPRSSEVRDVALTLADRFPARGTDPVTVIADTDPDSTEFLAWYQQLSTTRQVVGTSIRPDTPSGLTVVDVTPAATSQGSEASEFVAELRRTRPAFDTEVGGIAADLVDIKARLSERLPLAALLVVAATIALLFLMTGSIIVPIKAVLMNILSLDASFGAPASGPWCGSSRKVTSLDSSVSTAVGALDRRRRLNGGQKLCDEP